MTEIQNSDNVFRKYVAELLGTFALVFFGCGSAVFAGKYIGFTLFIIHLVGIPITGTSVNPARSIGTAVFVGGTAMAQLWMFVVAPIIGGIIAAIVWMVLLSPKRQSGS